MFLPRVFSINQAVGVILSAEVDTPEQMMDKTIHTVNCAYICVHMVIFNIRR